MTAYADGAWSSDPLTTEGRATIYASARQWADWATATEAQHGAAILEASTYVRAAWAPPRLYTEGQDEAVQDSVAEIARLALAGPLIGGQAAGQLQRKRIKAGSVEIENAESTVIDLQRQKLALATLMLQAAGATLRGSGANVKLAKS